MAEARTTDTAEARTTDMAAAAAAMAVRIIDMAAAAAVIRMIDTMGAALVSQAAGLAAEENANFHARRCGTTSALRRLVGQALAQEQGTSSRQFNKAGAVVAAPVKAGAAADQQLMRKPNHQCNR